MRVGFDLDGVLCDIDIAMLRLIDNLDDENIRGNVELWYYKSRKPYLNPYMYTSIDDEMFVVTGRSAKFKRLTNEWIDRYLPFLHGKVYVVGEDGDDIVNCSSEEEVQAWVKRIMQRKADKINELELDVFFDDSCSVPILRKLCPKTKIIQVGGQL